MENHTRPQLELKILEDLEAAEAVSIGVIVFRNTSSGSDLFSTHSDNEYIRRLFPGPMLKKDIIQICNREKLEKILFVRAVDGSKTTKNK